MPAASTGTFWLSVCNGNNAACTLHLQTALGRISIRTVSMTGYTVYVSLDLYPSALSEPVLRAGAIAADAFTFAALHITLGSTHTAWGLRTHETRQ